MKKIKLKLCGNHSLQDLQYSVNSEADFIGIVFANSKRKVDAFECGKWMKRIQKKQHQKFVGVFVNPTLEEVSSVLTHVSLDIIQLHGHESIEQVLELKHALKIPVWKAIHHSDQGLNKMQAFAHIVDGYVIDSKATGAWGGTGVRFDWTAVPSYMNEARRQNLPCFIAGGITPDNVQRLFAYSPYGIDVSSGIETNGRKDNRKIQLIIERLKKYDGSLSG